MLFVGMIVVLAIYLFYLKPSFSYAEAVELLDSGKYTEAQEVFLKLKSFKDSPEMVNKCEYMLALGAFNNEDYEDALEQFKKIQDYGDSLTYIEKCEQRISELKYEALLGTYTGSYNAGQGESGVTLTFYLDKGAVKAIFEFYNLPGQDNVTPGSYIMTVHEEDAGFSLEGEEWVNKPSSYSMLSFKGKQFDNFFCAHDPYSLVVSKESVVSAEITEVIPGDAKEWDGHFYYLYNDQNISCWEEAAIYCRALGGHLATISSSEENSALFSMMKADGCNAA